MHLLKKIFVFLPFFVNLSSTAMQSGNPIIADRIMKLLSLSKQQDAYKTFEGHQREITALACGSGENNDIIVSASKDRTIRVWSPTGDCIQTLQLDKKPFAVVLGTGNWLANGSGSKVQVWHWRMNEKLMDLEGHEGKVTSLAFSPEYYDDFNVVPTSRYLISGSFDHDIRIWDTTTKTCINTIRRYHPFIVSAVSFMYGEHFSSASGQEIRHWNLKDLVEGKKFVNQPTPIILCDSSISYLQFFNETILKAFKNEKIQTIKYEDEKEVDGPQGIFAFNSDATKIIVADVADNNIRLWRCQVVGNHVD
jgi:WD40 repeat protein